MTTALRESGVRPVIVGTITWVVGLAVAVVTGGAWSNPWFWTCLVGIVSGLLGIPYLLRRQRRIVASGTAERGTGQASAGSSAD